jgi:hypothetical protein
MRSTIKADLFLVREWAETRRQRYWATIWWKRQEPRGTTRSAIHDADEHGACIDCEAAPTRAQAERIGRDYARRLGLRLPRPQYT